MRKKSFVMILMMSLMLFFSACFPGENKPNPTPDSFSSMHTNIILNFDNQETLDKHFWHIKEIYDMYEVLTDNYQELKNNQYKHNLTSINELLAKSDGDVEVEIDQELYDILTSADMLRIESNGHFNYGIGHIIDVWKSLIDETESQVISDEALNMAKSQVKNIDVILEPITFKARMNDSDPYVIIVKKGVKLDLGAYAKGYALQKVKVYLEEQQVKSYLINGGSSSIIVGEKNKKKEPDKYYKIGLSNPLYVFGENNKDIIEAYNYYGYYYIKNESITTSGTEQQYVVDKNGNRYHHLISPLTKEPANYYEGFTLIGSDAGVLDALSTAVFSMEPKVAQAFLLSKGIRGVSFNVDKTYSLYGSQTYFSKVTEFSFTEKKVN